MPNKRRARILSERLPLSKSFPMPTSQRNPMATTRAFSAREASSDEEGNGDEKTSRLSIAWNMEASVQHAGDQPLMPITGQQTDGLKENLQRPPDQLIESQAICEQSQAELSRQHSTTQADETAPRASDAHVVITLSCFNSGQEDQIPHVLPVAAPDPDAYSSHKDCEGNAAAKQWHASRVWQASITAGHNASARRHDAVELAAAEQAFESDEANAEGVEASPSCQNFMDDTAGEQDPAFRATEDDAGGAHEVPMEDRSIDITGDSSEHASHERDADEVTAPNQAFDAASPLAGESPMWPSQCSGPSWKSQ